tara:strand:- start:157 stop:669 length:513 start_codon:yes stop_codon:yes gene_type:complete
MLEVQEALTGILALLVLHFLLIWYYARGLVGIIEELAFPSDDPIMTSSLKEPVFEYEEEEPEEDIDLTPEQEAALLFAAQEIIEQEGLYIEEPAEDEVMAKEEPEVFSYDEKPKTSVLYEVGNYTESGEATLRQIKGMRKDDVIGICEIHGLDTEGTKAQLIERIKENAA